MSTENNSNEEVKEFTQTVQVTPSKEDDDDFVEEEENETPSSSSDEEKESEDEEESDTEEVEETNEPQEAEIPKTEPKPVEGETPRERALRLEATRLKGLLREQRKEELFVHNPNLNKQNIDEDLAEYDPEELKRFETLATKMGFAKKSEIQNQTIQDRNNNEFETFMEAHPEYAPENDTDGLLWNQFKTEFALYNPPTDPKTLKKVLNKVHNEIYGVQPAKNLNKINASQEKIKVASHTGSSAGKETKSKPQSPSGLRLDAMKGFSEEEIAELTS